MNSKVIRALKPHNKRYSTTLGDGLTLRIHPTGAKAWVARIYQEGKTRDVTLGHYPTMSLTQARQKVRAIRKAQGLQTSKGFTLNDAFKLWCKVKKNRITSYTDEKARLQKHAIDPLGKVPIDEITAPLVIQTLRPLERTGRLATLKRVLMRLREVLDFAIYSGFITHNPLNRVSRLFERPTVTHMPTVDWRDLETALRALKGLTPKLRLLLLWSLLNLLRPSEGSLFKWAWIDHDTATIPADHTKNRRALRIPLDEFTQAVLESLEPKESPYLFSGRFPNKPISSQALTKALRGSPLRGQLVAHGLRSIGRTWLADNGTPYEIAEACLNHVSGSQVSRAYLHSDYLDQRRAYMTAWRAYVFTCASRARFFENLPMLARLSEKLGE